MNAIIVYGWMGVGVFGLLMLYRIGKMLFGKSKSLIPDVSDVAWPYWALTRLDAAVIVFGACLIAWPVAVYLFLFAPKDPPAAY